MSNTKYQFILFENSLEVVCEHERFNVGLVPGLALVIFTLNDME